MIKDNFFFLFSLLLLIGSHPLHWLETVRFIIRFFFFELDNAPSGFTNPLTHPSTL